VALLLLWFRFCFKDAMVPRTASTADQLEDILRKEVRLWLCLARCSIASHLPKRALRFTVFTGFHSILFAAA
jgi:hypothetical protein